MVKNLKSEIRNLNQNRNLKSETGLSGAGRASFCFGFHLSDFGFDSDFRFQISNFIFPMTK